MFTLGFSIFRMNCGRLRFSWTEFNIVIKFAPKKWFLPVQWALQLDIQNLKYREKLGHRIKLNQGKNISKISRKFKTKENGNLHNFYLRNLFHVLHFDNILLPWFFSVAALRKFFIFPEDENLCQAAIAVGVTYFKLNTGLAVWFPSS